MSQQLSSLGGDGPNRFGQFDFEEEEIPEGKNETAIYILKSYSSGIESRIKDEFASWEVFFITSEEDFTEKTQYYSPEAVFIPFLAGGPLKEFQISIIELMSHTINKRLNRPNIYIEGAGGRVITKDFGEESSIHNTIEFIRSSIPSSI